MNKPQISQPGKIAFQVTAVLVGNIIYALGVVLFVLPGHLITGGSTGIGLFVERLWGIPVSAFVLVFNTAMFLLGWAVLGSKFAATTAVSSFFYPLALQGIQTLLGDVRLTENQLLCALFGGLCIGLAIGMVVRVGASTGGMDIPPLVLHKLLRLPVSGSIYVFDVLILLLQAFMHDGETILYGLLLVMTYTITLDKCLTMGAARLQVKVVSKQVQEIRREILTQVDRGVTMLNGETGYLENETQVLLTVITPRELAKTEQLVHRIDPEAFVIVSRVSEVTGRGFSADKKYLSQNQK